METQICILCHKEKNADDFTQLLTRRKFVCKKCVHVRNVNSINKPAGFFKNLIRSAKKNSNRRGQACELEFEDIMQLYEWQDGYCYYSGILMNTQYSFEKILYGYFRQYISNIVYFFGKYGLIKRVKFFFIPTTSVIIN